MLAFLIQLTDLLTESVSTIYRQRKRGKVGHGEWEKEYGSNEI